MQIDDRRKLRDKVREAYSSAAERPAEKHPFPVGRSFAESIGYPPDLLDRLPAVSVASFTGVSNVSIFADIPEGSAVLDLGCGGGLDTLIAAERTGPEGRVIAVDFSEAMIRRAEEGARKYGCRNVTFHVADAEELPLPDDSIDIALVNGIFNLSPFRERVFSELARVLRDSGSVYAAELVLREPLPVEPTCSLDNWFR
ncbi:MAG: methyltransferase domain-containing protein [Chloroflexota bacterium]